MQKLCFLLSVIFITTNLFSQITFTNNREKFVKELQSAISSYSDESDFFKKTLIPQLTSKEINDEMFENLVNTSNLIITKKLKVYPEVFYYVYSVSNMVSKKTENQTISDFQKISDQILNSKNYRKFEDYIDFSAKYMKDGQISSSSGTKWMYKAGKFKLEYKNDKPSVNFENGTLACYIENSNRQSSKENPYSDSIIIEQTKGTFDPISKKWEGKGGKVSWEKVGLSKDKSFAILESYSETLKNATFSCDTVTLTTPYFNKPIQGRFSDRASKTSKGEADTYPKFRSFENILSINNIKTDIDYIGGFSLEGASFVGTGTSQEPAKLYIKEKNKPFIKVMSTYINVDKDKITSPKATIAIYTLEKDSITHPSLEFKFIESTKTFEFTRGNASSSQAPFTNSYNKVQMYVPKITWEKGSEEIFLTYEFGTSQDQRVAKFESNNFFDGQLYEQLQGMQSVHPLVAISKHMHKYDLKELKDTEVASALGKILSDATPILLNLNRLGFINYDSESKIVTPTSKLRMFVDSKAGLTDYDNLSFISDMRPLSLTNQYTPEQIKADKRLQKLEADYKKINEQRRTLKNFGVLSLKTHSIHLYAVDQVKISEPQMTSVFPKNNEIILRYNRDFIFNGWINAGKIEIDSYDSFYDYANNKIKLSKTGESFIKVRPLKEEDGKSLIALNSAISGIVGELLVDAPNNRSGKSKDISDYPKIIVAEPAKVYYNNKKVQHGVYDSTRFYFTIAPFTMDSLDNFKESTFNLKGELISAGIFPKINESLKIMPDYSLGFSTMAPKEGYDFYATGAKYDNKIILSNNGLQGAGKIDFLKSTSISKAFTFMPDSTVGIAQFKNLAVESGLQFPDVEGEDVYITYVPKSEVLKAKSTSKNLNFFGSQAKLNGTAIVTKKGMTGFGNMQFKTANVSSYNFKFERWDIKADTSNFALKNTSTDADEDPLSFKTDNVSSNISFKTRTGKFISNQGESKVTFPVNQYMCKMDVIDWFMDQDEIDLSSNQKQNISIDANLDLAQNNFFSLHPKQDSLQFRAPKAKFSIKDKTIYCDKTEYIDVADARIYPDSMKVTIRKKAILDKLENSKIIANYITKYHTFVEASTQINGRKSYNSIGKYPYKDADSNMTLIAVDKIYLDSSYQTVAIGKIVENAKFKLSPQFDYYGDFKILAANKLINFNGATRINHECEKFPQSWMSFASMIDPKNIQIPVSEKMKTLDGKNITAGIIWKMSAESDSLRLYPAFLSELKSENDAIVITANGFLQYNQNLKEYQISSKEKLENNNTKGNFVSLHAGTCSMKGIGKINLGIDYSEVKVEAVGVANYNQETNQTTMNITVKYNLPLDKSSLEAVADKIVKTEGLKQENLNIITLEQTILEWVDQKAVDKLKEDYIVKNEVKKLPKELENGIVISGMKLTSYNKENKGFITNTNEAFLVNFYDKPIMKKVPFKASFMHGNSIINTGNEFGFQINVPGKNYYFDYRLVKKDGEMRIFTSDNDLINSLNAMKDDKRKSKNFKYEITTNDIYLTNFLDLFNN